MAYATHALSPSDTPVTRATTPARPGLFIRFFRAFHDARMRQAEREIALYIERRFLAPDIH